MSERDPAAARFFALVALRFGGVVIAFLGIAILVKRLIEPAELIGFVLMAVGAFDVLVLPALLARRWRSADTPPPK